MNKVRKKFVLYALVAVFVLLTVLLSILNGINFTMVTEDADRVTQMIAGGKGAFGAELEKGPAPGGRDDPGRMGLMGPDSPELPYTARYFTFRFNENGEGEEVAFNISAFTRQQALQMAQKLKNEETGWVNLTYRYRVYQDGGYTYVTVVDQGREMLPSYRILVISIFGELVGLAVCFAFLVFISRRLFRPLEDADRKQKQFIAEAENEFKIPLTVINADAEILEKENGPSEYTQSIHRQVKKMTALTKQLGALAIFDDKEAERTPCDISLILTAAIGAAAPRYRERGMELNRQLESGILIEGDEEALQRMADELVENSLKFSLRRADFVLQRQDGRVILTASNDTDLPGGDVEQVFDRFTRLGNAEGKPGSGLGLSYVKDIVRSHNGRVSAQVDGGEFILRVTL